VDPAEGALEALQRVTAQIRQHWPEVTFIVRGDSAYGREDIMSWCEGQPHLEYVLAHASNTRLVRATHTLAARAQAAYQQHRQAVASSLSPLLEGAELSDELDALVPPQVWYQSLHYRTHTSWSRARRVVCKLTYGATGVHRHFVVTSLPLEQVRTGRLHRDCYAPRGEMENRIKEHQLDLFSDRISTHEFESNQLRLWFSSFAYLLRQALRQHALATPELADAQLGTIRLKLLKLAAQVRISARRIHIAFSRACPSQALFQRAYDQLYRLARPG